MQIPKAFGRLEVYTPNTRGKQDVEVLSPPGCASCSRHERKHERPVRSDSILTLFRAIRRPSPPQLSSPSHMQLSAIRFASPGLVVGQGWKYREFNSQGRRGPQIPSRIACSCRICVMCWLSLTPRRGPRRSLEAAGGTRRPLKGPGCCLGSPA